MKLRTSRGLVAIALGTALVLSGCASGNDGGASPSPSESTGSGIPTPSAADVAAVEAITVTGDAGAEATLEFEPGLEVSAPTTRIVNEGTGEELVEGNQVTMHFVSYNGADAAKAGESTWATDSPQSFTLGDPQFDLLNPELIGQKVGTRMLLANPIEDADGVTTVINLVEVVSTKEIPTRAEGEAVTPADGLPVVTLDDSGKPSVEIPEGYTAPTELVVQPLIKGSGPEVTADSTITAHYAGYTLDGEQFEASWDSGTPASFPLTGVIQGWTQGLAGQTVGSQVLLVIPPALAYGSAEGHELQDETLVFVVDILDAS
ncbi:FKBP-type peptidyl-prolyl cis-trans isomerase [Oerskovia sp. Sa1BUA8]|uniref:Peptidyl-prolyl cis-trans isomerase n=1 Tax=Oerskovia douganii TaxID=2762210 RepID=A0A9D5UDY9_9CELL|nr:FKBP-type peptidyl-prolyl cis-trans isomerase [Oerskovia douganii]MBE7702241.1 FKBP-type peptidyl-prolyl cis-trans isomerase [Oerskovia douganii]